jgi:predicted RecA/RadA family phage recombinase
MSFIAQFVHDGKSVDYTPAAAVDAGDVIVQGSLVGISTRAIAANALGALAVDGVFDVDKDTSSGTAITAGADVYWDSGNDVATTTAGGNTLMGKAVEAADDDDEKVRVRLSQ